MHGGLTAVFLVFSMQIEFVKAATAACNTAWEMPAEWSQLHLVLHTQKSDMTPGRKFIQL